LSLRVREAEPADAPAVSVLLGELGYPTSGEEFERRLEAFSGVAGTHVIVVEDGGEVVGLAAMQVMPLVHRDLPVARITVPWWSARIGAAPGWAAGSRTSSSGSRAGRAAAGSI